jgi:outer membrane receptor protein involved in Fe transport
MPTRTGVFCLVAMLLLVAAARAQQPLPSPSPSARATPSAVGVSVRTKDQTSNQGAQQPLQMQEVVVEGQRIEPSASAQSIPAREYALKPHDTPIQILNDLPGLVATQHQGGGKAPQYLIRGFDADHGTDFAVFADDTPVNLVSHAHGQGYADINFVIPETIDHLDFSKGPYYAKYGDFDNAGALNIVTKDEFDHPFVHAEGGSWGTQRYVAGASPKLLDNVSTLFAGQAYFSNGPFIAPAHDQRYSFLGKIGFQPTTRSTLLTWLSLYMGRWDGSGQIPLSEVSRGLLNRFGSEDPHEGGYTDRESFNLRYVYKPNDRDKWTFQAYVTRYKLGLFTDFTFYKDSGLRFISTQDGHIIDTRNGPIVPGANYVPGDGIEQNDARVTYGGSGTYSHSSSLLRRPLQSEFGIQNRNDNIDLGLYRQVLRQRFFIVNRAHIVERSASGWAEERIFPTNWIELVAGLRGDIYFFHAGNRLPGQPADPNFQPVSITGGTTASIVSPKASVILTPIEDTSFYFNFGTGFHSNDAREAILTRDASFAPLARSIRMGGRSADAAD